MMGKIIVTGWNEGFNKIQFNQFIRSRCGFGLAEAKAIVDEILHNKPVELEFVELSESDKQKLLELGINYETG
jgi:ribosomal protein L7/L12